MTTAPPLVFIDVETTGLHPDRARIWEIAMIVRGVESVDRDHRVVIDTCDLELQDADPAALTISGFYDRHPGVAPDAVGLGEIESAAARMVALITAGATLVGVNPAFDADLLGRMLRRHGLAPGWHHHLIDMTAVARGWLSSAHVDPPQLQASSYDLSRACGVTPPGPGEAHTALGDAEWVRRWYDHIFV